MIKTLPLHTITLRRDFQCRMQGLSQDMVQDYIVALDNGAQFPPIEVYETPEDELLLVDGFHRYHAHKSCFLDIKANVTQGTEQEARDYAIFHANRKNGQRLTNKDKQAIVNVAVADPRFVDLSSRQLAKVIGVGHDLISRTRKSTGVARHTSQFGVNREISQQESVRNKEATIRRELKRVSVLLNRIDEWEKFADPHQLAELVRQAQQITLEN